MQICTLKSQLVILKELIITKFEQMIVRQKIMINLKKVILGLLLPGNISNNPTFSRQTVLGKSNIN